MVDKGRNTPCLARTIYIFCANIKTLALDNGICCQFQIIAVAGNKIQRLITPRHRIYYRPMNIGNKVETRIFVSKNFPVVMSLQTEIAEQFCHTVNAVLFRECCHFRLVFIHFRNGNRLCMNTKAGRLCIVSKWTVAHVYPLRIMIVQRIIYFQKELARCLLISIITGKKERQSGKKRVCLSKHLVYNFFR